MTFSGSGKTVISIDFIDNVQQLRESESAESLLRFHGNRTKKALSMTSPTENPAQDEASNIRRCIEGDLQALAGLRQAHHSTLLNVLLARGASLTEANDLLADLWGDCVSHSEDQPSLLEKFSGKCGFSSWLMTVVTNRLIDLKRKVIRRKTFTPEDPADGSTAFIARVPGEAAQAEETGLIDLLRRSLEEAFNQCPSEGLLMLRLVFLQGLTQRELAAMWACHEATISRALNQAMQEIEKITMAELKKRDPWIELSWQDFLQLCQTQQIGFL